MKKKVSLGCGNRKPEGFHGVDQVDTDAADQVADLDLYPWPLPEDHFHTVHAFHVLEHLEHPVKAIEEIHRICRDGATVVLKLPHFSGVGAYNDLTHTRSGVGSEFLDYFTERHQYNFYSDARFHILQKQFRMQKRKKLPWNYMAEPLVNLVGPYLYERTFLCSLFPCREIEVTAEAVKA